MEISINRRQYLQALGFLVTATQYRVPRRFTLYQAYTLELRQWPDWVKQGRYDYGMDGLYLIERDHLIEKICMAFPINREALERAPSPIGSIRKALSC